MALFKILRGNSSKLFDENGNISAAVPFNDGYCYFTPDNKKFYIDWLDELNGQHRDPLNSLLADTLLSSWTDVNNVSHTEAAKLVGFTEGVAEIHDNNEEIPTSAVLYAKFSDIENALVTKQDAITGASGQVVGFNAAGKPVPMDMPNASSVIEQNKGLSQKFWRGTQAEYDAVETKSDDTMYIITDDAGAVEGTGNMHTSIYDPKGIATDIFSYVDEHSANIPITSTPSDDVKIWIDPNEEGYSSGEGTNIPASDTEPEDGNYWLDTNAEGGSYYTAGEVDTLLAGKAPAGYGLGASSKNVTDWNNEKTNGWVRDPSGTEDKHSPFIGLFSVGLISDYLSGGDAFQLAFARNQYAKTRTYIKFRAFNADNDVWGEWEWVNPPMELGVEYRTTERYQGKPVYVKAIDFGALPNTTKKHVDIDNQNHARAIRVSGLLNNGTTIPGTDENQTDGSKPLQCYGYNNNVCIYAPYDASYKTAVVTVWYTKTTD